LILWGVIDSLRFWQAIVASVLVHAALLNIPIGVRSVREVECVEMRFVIEAAPAAPPAGPQSAHPTVTAAVRPAPETPSEAVKRPALTRPLEPSMKKMAPRPKVNSLPKALLPSQTEPVPAVEDERPADVRIQQPAAPAEAAAAADSGGAPEAPADGRSAQQQAAVAGGRSAGYGVGPAALGAAADRDSSGGCCRATRAWRARWAGKEPWC
jgi:hypothetical protein